MAQLVEPRQHLIQREILAAALPSAQFLIGRVGHYAVEPGPEGRLAAEGVDLPHHRPERILHDFLGILPIAGDAAGQAISALAISRDQELRRPRLAAAKCPDKVAITVSAGWGVDVVGLSLEHPVKAHRGPSLLVVGECVTCGRQEPTRRSGTLLPDISRVGIHPPSAGLASLWSARSRRRCAARAVSQEKRPGVFVMPRRPPPQPRGR